jgi:thiamine biosynthesis lipoprotein
MNLPVSRALRLAPCAAKNYNNSMKRFLLLAAAAVLLCAIACSCSSGGETPQASGEYYALDTICSQQATGGDARAAVSEVAAMLARITNEMSMNEGSDLFAVNSAAPRGAQVSKETASLLQTALSLASLTDGAFDPTIGAVSSLWDISGDPRVPAADELAAAVKRVGYTGIAIDGTTVTLAQPGMMLDLGGIGKGYAADLAAAIYQKHGVKSALLNLGGNILVYGAKSDGSDFRIGLRDPYGSENDYFAVISAHDTSVVTSGVYERFFVSGGIAYHHLFDPETGYPVNNGLAAVTVVCQSSTKADALSTALFVMGLKDGLKLAETLEDIEAVFVTEDKEVFVTDGLKGSIGITNENFILQG